MQLTPRFESFKILEQHPLLKDDTGNDMCLTLFECFSKPEIKESDEYVHSVKIWAVVSNKQTQWANKAVSYSSNAFYSSLDKNELFEAQIKGFEIKEIKDGEHTVFNSFGLKTRFTIKKIED